MQLPVLHSICSACVFYTFCDVWSCSACGLAVDRIL